MILHLRKGVAFCLATQLICVLFICVRCIPTAQAAEGAQTIEFYGYDDCIQLKNERTEVVLCPAAGGRVLSYSLDGKNVLYLPDGVEEGWVWDGGDSRGKMNAGRFDIGPEQMVARRNTLWQGRWSGKVTGDRRAELTSPVDDGPGVSLVRTFALDEHSSKLTCTQTIVSASDEPLEYCHWSRTFANGKGICVVPLSKLGRFPAGYVRYDPPGRMLNMLPTDEHVVKQGDFLIVDDHPQNPKLGFDSHAGWLAYYAPQDLLFIKKFPTYPERAYNEVAGLTISIWYPDDEMVELEPIGPSERLSRRGDQASFTETWFLLDQPFPQRSAVSGVQVEGIVKRLE